ncbi:hypothetical protein DPMN_094230 [Dreissena polymorpha]|uniref:Uncharacterized protein n=1 Tax=Dreissena polymorpha TaxID=45954 RepID=A0A9D4R3C7_DREPO|nr:hypothetical protein DPMN_094230 [Dreissena polymorpha]
MAYATLIFDCRIFSLQRECLQHAKNVHDTDPFELPTELEVVHDPETVICESTPSLWGDVPKGENLN